MSNQEKSFRFQVWLKNYKKVQKWNNETAEGLHTFNLGINFLTDLVPVETEAYYGLYRNQAVEINKDLYGDFINFKQDYNKTYKSVNEEINRFQIWIKNYNLIVRHNRQASTNNLLYTLKMNFFGDLVSSVK